MKAHGMDESEARKLLNQQLPQLERWKLILQFDELIATINKEKSKKLQTLADIWYAGYGGEELKKKSSRL